MKELSLHILDLAQNSITAEASLIELDIIEDMANDLLTIKLRDNGRGMDDETVEKVNRSVFYDPYNT